MDVMCQLLCKLERAQEHGAFMRGSLLAHATRCIAKLKHKLSVW